MRPPATLPTAILAGLGLHPDRVARLSSGLASQAWRIDSDGAATVLRISSWPPDEPTTYRSEHALLGRLTQLGASVPAPITGHWRHPELPAPPFSLTAFLEGAPLRPSPDHAAIEAMATFLRELHGIEARRYGPLLQADHVEAIAPDPVAGLRERWSGLHAWLIDDVDLADHPAFAEHRELLEAASAHQAPAFDDAMASPMALVHSDLHEENILESDAGLAFIDFGETFRGTAAWEFASLAYFLGWPLADAVLAAYVGDPARLGRWRDPVSRLGLSFGLSRWEQDRSSGVDEDVHDEAFLRATVARL